MNEIINLIHEENFSIDKCIFTARKVFYWPRLAIDILSFIKRCPVCEISAEKNEKETMNQFEIILILSYFEVKATW